MSETNCSESGAESANLGELLAFARFVNSRYTLSVNYGGMFSSEHQVIATSDENLVNMFLRSCGRLDDDKNAFPEKIIDYGVSYRVVKR